jgi:hypothetical protein
VSTADLAAASAALQEAHQRHADAATIARRQADLKAVTDRAQHAVSAAMGGFTNMILRFLGGLVLFFMQMVTLSLINGALTIAIADRVTGGAAGWREAWSLLLRRLPPLLATIVPAMIITAFGFVLLFVPGLILCLLFAFVAPAVLVEGLRGREALRRSVDLVGSDWLRVAIMIIALAILGWFAQVVGGALFSASALFLRSLLGDLLTVVVLPFPLLGMVLLYLDIRRKRDGYTPDRLRADLDALKTA